MVVLFELQGYTGCNLEVDYGNGDVLNVGPVSGPLYTFNPADFGRDTINGIYRFECDDNCSFTKVISDDCVSSGSTENGECGCTDELALLEARILNLENQTQNVNGVIQFTKYQRAQDVNGLTPIPSNRATNFNIDDLGWVDNPDNASGTGNLFAVTTTLNLNNPANVSGWSNPIEYGGSAADARRYKELFIFRRSDVLPQTPPNNQAQYNFATDDFIPPSGWSGNASTAPGSGTLYLSTGYATGFPTDIDTAIEWSDPVRFDGDDGTRLNIVYQRMLTQPPTPLDTPTDDPLTTGVNESIPSGWFETAYGDQSQGRLWASVGYLFSNATQWVWDEPYAAEGLDGEDGTDLEFIFKVTTTDTKPNQSELTIVPSGDPAFQQRDFIPTNWFDDAQEVNAINPYQWYAKRERISGVWQPFGPIHLWNQFSMGQEGRGYIELFIYRSSLAQGGPPAPGIGASYDFNTGTLIPPTDWFTTVTAAVADNPAGTIYASTTRVVGFPSDIIPIADTAWSQPFEFTGKPGTLLDVIFKRFPIINSGTTLPIDENFVSDDLPLELPVDVNNRNVLPIGNLNNWYGKSVDVPMISDSRLWAVITYLEPNSDVWRFKTPYITEGIDGRDGDSIEYVFILTKSDTISPANPTPPDISEGSTYQTVQEYITILSGNTYTFPDPAPSGGTYTTQWTDDPLSVNENFRFQWASVRRKVNNVWGSFSNPALWSTYAVRGDDGQQGNAYKEIFLYAKFLPGQQPVSVFGGSYQFSLDGPSGDTLTPPSGWYVDLNAIPPCAPDVNDNPCVVYVIAGTASGKLGEEDSNIEWSTPVKFTAEPGNVNLIYRRSELLDGPPQPAPTLVASPIPVDWSDTLSGATGSGRIWASFGVNPPESETWRWGEPYALEGIDGLYNEYIYKLTSGSTRPSTPFSDPNIDDYLPDVTWFDEVQDVNNIDRYQWISERKKQVNGTWGPYSIPKLYNRFLEEGIRIEFGNDVATYGVNQLSDPVPNTIDTPLATSIFVYDGITDVTNDYNLSILSETGITGLLEVVSGEDRYRVTSMDPVENGVARISAEKDGYNVVRDFKVQKLLNGTPGTSFKVFSDNKIIKIDESDNPLIPSITIFTQITQSTPDGLGSFNTNVSGYTAGIVRVFANGGQVGSDLTGSASYTFTLPPVLNTDLVIEMYLPDGTTLVDIETISRASDGRDGVGAYSLLLTNDGDSFPVTQLEQTNGFTTNTLLGDITTDALLYQGDDLITNPAVSGWTFDIVDEIGITGATLTNITGGVRLSGLNRLDANNGGSLTIRAIKSGSTFRKTFRIAARLDESSVLYQIKANTPYIPVDSFGVPKQSTFVFSAGRVPSTPTFLGNLIYEPNQVVTYSIDGGTEISHTGTQVDRSVNINGLTNNITIRLYVDGTLVDTQTYTILRDGDIGDSSVIYFIRSRNGNFIKNNSGTITLDIVQMSGSTETIITSGDIKIRELGASSPITTKVGVNGTDYTPEITDAAVEGILTLELYDYANNTALNSFTVGDVTDGLPSGYVTASSGFTFQNKLGETTVTPSQTTITGVFTRPGNSNEELDVSVSASVDAQGTPQLSFSVGGQVGAISLSAIIESSNIPNINNIVSQSPFTADRATLRFENNTDGRVLVADVYFVRDGSDGPEGKPAAKSIIIEADVAGDPPMDITGLPTGSQLVSGNTTTPINTVGIQTLRVGTTSEGSIEWVVGDVIIDTSEDEIVSGSTLTWEDTQYTWNGFDWTIATTRRTNNGIIVDSLFANRLAANQAFIDELSVQTALIEKLLANQVTIDGTTTDSRLSYSTNQGIFDVFSSAGSNPLIALAVDKDITATRSWMRMSGSGMFMRHTNTNNALRLSVRDGNANIGLRRFEVIGEDDSSFYDDGTYATAGGESTTAYIQFVLNGTMEPKLIGRADGASTDFVDLNPTTFTYIGSTTLRNTTLNGDLSVTGTTTLTGAVSLGSNMVATGTITASDFLLSSDINLKENITNIENPLEKVLGLNGVMFDWKKDGKHDTGLIAQEVEQVMPEVVHTNEDGEKSVSYPKLVGLLVEAIKELNSKIEDK